jgi:aminobenzoyl-glutamate transport protein
MMSTLPPTDATRADARHEAGGPAPVLPDPKPDPPRRSGGFLDWVERTGNRLPDPALHFLIALVLVWVASAALSWVDFGLVDPRTGQPLRVINQLTPQALTRMLEGVVTTFTGFPPLGIVLVMALGVGVAEQSGLVGAGLRRMLDVAPRRLLTPMLVFVTILGSVGGDATLLVMAPLGGVAFFAAGRHPVAGILAAFAANNFLVAGVAPTGLDMIMQGFTQKAAQVLDPSRTVNPLCNWGFAVTASVTTTLACWLAIDRIVERRLSRIAVDGDEADLPRVEEPSARERRALVWAVVAAFALVAVIALAAAPHASPLRAADGGLLASDASLMKGLVPLLFLLAVVPGLVFGYRSGRFTSHKDVIGAMSRTMSQMGYFMVLVFFAAQFIRAFGESNLGALLALKGGLALKALALPPLVTLGGLIGLSSLINLLVASASAKWAMLASIFVPMLMTAGISPEATQLAYRIGDSATNILTPLNYQFPLVIAFCARYVRGIGIGTLISLCLPIAAAAMVTFGLQLAVFWLLGIPMGLEAPYLYP